VGRLRAVRKAEKIGERVVLSAADPLNLVGIVTPEARVPAVHTNKVLLEDGLPIAALEGGEVRRLAASTMSDNELRDALTRRTPRHAAQLHPRTLGGREAQGMANRTVH
jgi:ATP-dependent Lhr-like helicase